MGHRTRIALYSMSAGDAQDVNTGMRHPHSHVTLFSSVCTVQNFRFFIGILEERGVDMSSVEISKAEAVLWG